MVDNLIPITRPALDKALMLRLPGVVRSEGSGKSKHNKKAEKSIVYAMTGPAPKASHHISGLQVIRVQATQIGEDILTTSTSGASYNGTSFTLSGNVPNSSSYTSVFDEYRIEMIETWISPSISQATTASATIGQWTSAVDYDDANTPSSISTVSDKQNSVASTTLQAHYHKWVPKFAIGAYSGTFVSFASDVGWVDCGSPNVQHYGLKIAVSTTPQVQYFSQVTRLTVAFRSPGIS
jgi:hypothetical protein